MKFSRFGGAMLALSALFMVATGAAAATAPPAEPSPEAAAAFVSDVVDGAVEILRDREAPVEDRSERLAERLREGFDLNYISRFVLGRHWRRATPEQRREYQELFADFIIGVYSDRLEDYADQTVAVGQARRASSKDVIVASKIVRNDGPPIVVDWRVRQRDTGFKVIDLKVEGISMAISQREEFSAVIQRDGLDGLIDNLRQKARDGDPHPAGDEAGAKPADDAPEPGSDRASKNR